MDKSYTWIISGTIFSLALISLGTITLVNNFDQKILPHVYVDEVDVSRMSVVEAREKLITNQPQLASNNIILQLEDKQISSSSAQLEKYPDVDEAISSAFAIGRSGQPHTRLKNILTSLFIKTTISTPYKYKQHKIKELVEISKNVFNDQGHFPQATLKTSGNAASLTVDSGHIGHEVDEIALTKLIVATAKNSQDETITVPTSLNGQEISPEETNTLREFAKKLVNKSVRLFHPTVSTTLNDKELVSLVEPGETFSSIKAQEILAEKSKNIDRDPENAVFEYDTKTLKVQKFSPHRPGIKLDTQKTSEKLLTQLENFTHNSSSNLDQVEMVVSEVMPEITLANTNDLGINELIGTGESEYAHSIPNRVHNVSITTDRISGTIVPPGKEFSFNKTLGEVSRETGYRPAYVISSGKTVLGDGGGVCQVSSTLFRAILDSGLKVTRRLQHSYRVSYYELNSDPGFDATVYAGETDFRFINDTNHHLLVFAQADPKKLYMRVEIYGTSDGRSSEIIDYKKWDASSPAPTQYIDEPSLPAGTIKQVDWAAGGIKTSFRRVVKDKDGQVLHDDTYKSNYQPWSAKYLRGTGN